MSVDNMQGTADFGRRGDVLVGHQRVEDLVVHLGQNTANSCASLASWWVLVPGRRAMSPLRRSRVRS